MWYHASSQFWVGRSWPYSVTTLKRICWGFPWSWLNPALAASSVKPNGMALGSPQSLVTASFFTDDFERVVLDRAICKPLHWFQYVQDNLFILPCGLEKLKGFHHHQNPQFNIEMATFLDIDIYERPDGSLGKVYCKPTHTNPYLNSALTTTSHAFHIGAQSSVCPG